MSTLTPKEFEKAQKVIDVLDSERRKQCFSENNLDGSKIEKFVSQYWSLPFSQNTPFQTEIF